MDTGLDTARADALAVLFAGAAPSADTLAALLAEAAPSAGMLGTLPLDALSAAGLVDGVAAAERFVSCATAIRARYLGALHARGEGDPFQSLEAEVGCALRWAPATTSNRMHEASALTRLFPETLTAVQAGEVSWEQARALTDLTAGLDDDKARLVQDKVLPRMPTQTVAETRRSLRYHVGRIDPEAAAKRHRVARKERKVAVWPECDGMASLNAYLPADIAQAVMATLTALARKRVKGDTRTLDQRRADTLAQIILSAAGVRSAGSQAPGIPTLTQVVVPISTLMGRCEDPALLKGYGPIDAEQARLLAFAQASKWRILFVDDTGALLGATARTYRPPAAIRKIIELRRPICCFPGCNMPAERCDLDHRKTWAEGGCTGQCNLDPVCRKHHNFKTLAGWSREKEADDTMTWTTPTHHTYTDDPYRYPTGLPDDDDYSSRFRVTKEP